MPTTYTINVQKSTLTVTSPTVSIQPGDTLVWQIVGGSSTDRLVAGCAHPDLSFSLPPASSLTLPVVYAKKLPSKKLFYSLKLNNSIVQESGGGGVNPSLVIDTIGGMGHEVPGEDEDDGDDHQHGHHEGRG